MVEEERTGERLKMKSNKFYQELKKARKFHTKLLKPKVCYTSEYDLFSMFWGNKFAEETIELNLLGSGDLRFDLTKNGTIVGIEIEDFSQVLKKFDCDKNKEFQKQIKRDYRKYLKDKKKNGKKNNKHKNR